MKSLKFLAAVTLGITFLLAVSCSPDNEISIKNLTGTDLYSCEIMFFDSNEINGEIIGTEYPGDVNAGEEVDVKKLSDYYEIRAKNKYGEEMKSLRKMCMVKKTELTRNDVYTW